jgi:MFS family permease
VVATLERTIGPRRTLLVAFTCFGLTTGIPGLTAQPLLIGALMTIGGVAAMSWNVLTVSLRQRVAPDHLLGRVNAGYRLLAWGSMPLGAFLGGVLADVFGLRAAFLIAAATCLAAIPLLLSVVTDGALAAAEAEAEATAVGSAA